MERHNQRPQRSVKQPVSYAEVTARGRRCGQTPRRIAPSFDNAGRAAVRNSSQHTRRQQSPRHASSERYGPGPKCRQQQLINSSLPANRRNWSTTELQRFQEEIGVHVSTANRQQPAQNQHPSKESSFQSAAGSSCLLDDRGTTIDQSMASQQNQQSRHRRSFHTSSHRSSSTSSLSTISRASPERHQPRQSLPNEQIAELADLLGNIQIQSQQAMEAIADEIKRPDLSHIPVYDGKTSFREFQATIQANFVMKNVPPHKRKELLFNRIKGDLHLWLLRKDRNNAILRGDYEDMVAYLDQMFPEKMTGRRKQILFRELVQGEESATEYFVKKEHRARTLCIDFDQHFWDDVVSGIKQRQIRDTMRRHVEDESFNPKTFESKLRKAEQKFKERSKSPAPFSFRPGFDCNQDGIKESSSPNDRSRSRYRDGPREQNRYLSTDRDKSRSTSRGRQRSSSNDNKNRTGSGSLKCWTCGQEGHRSSECPMTRHNSGVIPSLGGQPFINPVMPYPMPMFYPVPLVNGNFPMMNPASYQPPTLSGTNQVVSENSNRRRSEGQQPTDDTPALKSILRTSNQ